MVARSEDAYGAIPRPIEVGCCAACGLFWFDDSASIRLTPKGVLSLFQYIGQAGRASNTLASSFACPRCQGALAYTHDLQRTTHFTFWRCPRDHGQLMAFNQFLAEKNFIRAPSAGELAKLRATVRQISCSQCGAPIDLAKDDACTHCGAPIALIDPESVAQAVRELAATASAQPSAQDAATALGDAQIAALFDLQRSRGEDDRHDLLAVGAAAIGALLGGWLLSAGDPG
jgi:hypothetical protein